MKSIIFIKFFVIKLLILNFCLFLQAADTCESFLTYQNPLISKIKDLTGLENVSLESYSEILVVLNSLDLKIKSDPENLVLLQSYVKVYNMFTGKSLDLSKRYLEILAMLISKQGESEENLNLLYLSLKENKKFNEAESVARLLIKRNPNNLNYSAYLLYALKRQEKFKEMIDYGTTFVLRQNPFHIDTIDLLVIAYTELNKLHKKRSKYSEVHTPIDSAIELLQQLVNQNLALAKHITKLAELLYFKQRYQQVLDLFDVVEYMGFEIEKTQVLIFKFRTHTKLANFETAEMIINDLLSEFPDTIRFKHLKSWYHDEVVKYYRRQRS